MDPIIPYETLVFLDNGEVGRGNTGTVRKARMGDLDVVVKIRHRNDEEAIREWENEVQILRTLNNPHIVRYIGRGYDDHGFPMIVMEYGGVPFIPFFNKQSRNGGLTYRDAHNYLLQLADAIQYLHSKNVSHGDLKWENVLINSNNILKICDFGYSSLFRISSSDPVRVNDGKLFGNVLTIAPEYICSIDRHPTNDVYSFGVMCLILLSGKFPYTGIPLNGLTNSDIIQAVVDRQLILDIPKQLRNSYYGRLISSCTFLPKHIPWSYSEIVHSRPLMSDVYASLREHLH